MYANLIREDVGFCVQRCDLMQEDEVHNLSSTNIHMIHRVVLNLDGGYGLNLTNANLTFRRILRQIAY